MRALQVVLASALLALGLMDTTSAETKLILGVTLPRAQLGQPNGASADVAEPVRQALMSYLKGPVIEVIALEARIPCSGMLPMLGGGGMGNMATQMTVSAVAQGVMQTQMADVQEDAMANAMAAINGAQKSNVSTGWCAAARSSPSRKRPSSARPRPTVMCAEPDDRSRGRGGGRQRGRLTR